jgi:hypothetical protein
MFKKTLMIGLALLLILGVGLQAMPARAQGEPPIPAVVSATLDSVTILQGIPPRIRITGGLPAGCYKLRVGEPVVGKRNPKTFIRPITFHLRGVKSAICTSKPQRFTTTVTVDPFKLKLPAGRYVARFNSVKEQTSFWVFLTIPRKLD